MEKTGQVRPGKTPSTVSGLPSTEIVHGEPVREGEQPVDPGLEKLATALKLASDTLRKEDKDLAHE